MAKQTLRVGLVILVLAFCSLLAPTDAEAAGRRGLFQRKSASRATSQRSTSRLPGGRSYYKGRYYGNLNNRYYGPQYGYF